jgi:hypothetical protein
MDTTLRGQFDYTGVVADSGWKIPPLPGYHLCMSYVGAFPHILDAQKVVQIDDYEQFARCHFCGEIFPVKKAKMYWIHAETLDDGRELASTGIYCGEPCGDAMVASYCAGDG